jgi:hypothetical protein
MPKPCERAPSLVRADNRKPVETGQGKMQKQPKLERVLVSAIFLTGAALPVAAQTAAPPSGKPTANTTTVFGSLRVRQEVWDWFKPATSDFDNDYTFTGAILRVGASRKFGQNTGIIELAAPALLGLPENAVAPAPQGALGLGGNYRAANGDRQASLFVKQLAYQQTLSAGQTLKFGRQEFNEGTETTPPEPGLAYLKRDRISQRLIGTFAWTHIGRSFDAVQYVRNRPDFNLTAIAGFPTSGVFDLNGWNTLTDVRFAYAAATFPHYRGRIPGEGRVFALYSEDGRQVTKTDNATVKDKDKIQLVTIGGHLLAGGKTGNGMWDALFWSAAQFGDWGKQDHSSLAGAMEAGYRFRGAKSPWLRVGWFYASGDSDPADGKHKTFYAPLSTPRIYARTPFYTESNVQDGFVQVLYKPTPALQLRADFHRVSLANGRDLWYSGDGPFQSGPAFGLAGRKGNGSRSLADLLDFSADWTPTKRDSVTLYAGRMFGKSVVRGIYPTDTNGTFGYLEISHRF